MSGRGILIVKGRPSAIAARGIERLQASAPVPLDIVHDRAVDDPLRAEYDWILPIARLDGPTTGTDRAARLDADAWAVEVLGDHPTQIAIRAVTERARLYALYHIADCLQSGKALEAWAIRRRPLLPRRYAWPSAGNVWSPVFRPDQYRETLEALPGLGINGVLITFTPTHGTHYGRETIPFSLTEHGVQVDRQKLPAFRKLMDELKSYGLDVHLFHQAFTPPPFTSELVRAYYDGKRELPGFHAAVEASSRRLAEALFTHLPQVDGLLFHSIECEWMWGDAVSIFPCRDHEAAGGAFEAYLRGLSQACTAHGKDLAYWTHVSGVSARQIRLQHRLLAEFPEVMVVEDHAWPNNTWPFAPVMGHIAEDLRNEVVQGRFGLSIDTTDGEYYGAGALPTAYPEPHIRCARAAVDLGAEMSFVRMNEQSLTPLGTLEDINAIHVVAATEQWWEGPRPVEQLWKAWCTRRFGGRRSGGRRCDAGAAPVIVSALKKSRAFITKGVSAGGVPLMDHSGIGTYSWRPQNPAGAYALFARPGELLIDKPYDQLVGREFRPWQVKAHGVALDDFLRDSREAEAAMREALAEIKSVADRLDREDTDYLTRCFEDALVMIEAVRLAAVAARAHAVFTAEPNDANRETLADACDALSACADRIEDERGPKFRAVHWFMKTRLGGEEHAGYGVPIALRVIAEVYLASAAEGPKS